MLLAVSLDIRLWIVIISPVLVFIRVNQHGKVQRKWNPDPRNFLCTLDSAPLLFPNTKRSAQLGDSLWSFKKHMLKTDSLPDTIVGTMNTVMKNKD